MASQTTLRQRDRRYPIFRPQKAVVQFSHGHRDWRLPLVDLSVAGLSFVTDEEVPALGAGTKLDDVIVQIADCEIRGNLAIRHATSHPDWTTLYGAMFYPASEADLLKLSGVLAGIEALQPPRSGLPTTVDAPGRD